MEEKGRSHGRLGVRLALKPRDLMEDATIKGAFQVKVITLFPEAFPGMLGLSVTGKAMDLGLWRLDAVGLRQFGEGKHRNVDDTPAGGGAGMVIRPDVMERALAEAGPGPVIFLTPRGRPFDQAMARRLSQGEGMTLICGRFEGLDQRVIDHYGIEEVSMGDFVLTGGEIPAQALIDATVRLLPKVLGNADSAIEESFSDGLLEHPQYTRPAVWQGREVPAVLASGNHAEIAKWRAEQSRAVTEARRPDLWEAWKARARPALKGPALRKALRAVVAGLEGSEAALAWIDSGAELTSGRGRRLVCGLVMQDGGRVLLGQGPAGWQLPAVAVAPGELPVEAVQRFVRTVLRGVADLIQEAPVDLTLGTETLVLWFGLRGNARVLPEWDDSVFAQMAWVQAPDLPTEVAPVFQRFAAKLGA